MKLDIDWVKGAPARLEAGMVLRFLSGQVRLVGNIDDTYYVKGNIRLSLNQVAAWAWLVKPHELEWIEAIGARKP